VRVNDPAGDVLVHLGSSDYLRRYKIYVAHAQEWRQQFQKLESVDLRYDNQIIVNPDLPKPLRQAALSPASVKTAAAAGVKPAALVTRIGPHDRAVPKPAFELTEKKLNSSAVSKAVIKKPVTSANKFKRKKATAKAGAVANKPAARVGSMPAAAKVVNAEKKGTAAPSATQGTKGAAGAKPSPAIAKTQTNPGPAQ
jgi:cell division protein FtsQ